MNSDSLAARIVEAAVAEAEEVGWENVRLRLVARRLDLSSNDVLARFRDLDAVADAWFRRGWEAMLAVPSDEARTRAAGERLERRMLAWFDALAPHRRVTGQMIRTKLYPSHPHHWVPMIFNLSRTVHWLRDAAGLDAGGVRRQAEEVWLSALFLATLAVWLGDGTPGQQRTREFLRRRLGRGAPLQRTSRQAERGPPGPQAECGAGAPRSGRPESHAPRAG